MTDYTPGTTPHYVPVEQFSTTALPVYGDVQFGVLQSNGNCLNIGICRISTSNYPNGPLSRSKKRSCPTAEAELYPSLRGRLLAFFPKAGMLPCTERAFFRQPVFPVPVAYFLPESILTELPELQQNIIPAGLYPIRRSAEGYWVEF
jgi:hypothetical protein